MSLRVLTLNTAQLWWPLGFKGRQARILKLAKVLTVDFKDYDIFCFQELYRKDAKRTLITWLKDTHPYYMVDTSCGKWWIGTNSGLAIFSKIPIAESFKYVYKHYRGVEDLSRKSVWGVKVHYANEPEGAFYLFTTHMQTGIGAEPWIFKIFDYFSSSPGRKMTSTELKEAQAKELSVAIQKFAGDSSKVIATGDFNTPANSEAHQTLEEEMEKIGLFDTFDAEKSPLDTTVVGKERRIDYIWCDKTGESIVQEVFGNEVISDHYGVSAELDI